MSVEFNNGTDFVQFSNANAAAVLRALGLDPVDEYGEIGGELPGGEFHDRALMALATDPMEATPTFRDGGWIQVGRGAAYMQERLPELVDLACGAGRVWWG
ncbi:hypothetical protein [Nocardiopsis sp. LOL_012]|uniref:hypothetical protein n=1 Tax=Nocardiopsis sp. LOL_012 TaxID=3345409 RepID=UPI003A84AF6F